MGLPPRLCTQCMTRSVQLVVLRIQLAISCTPDEWLDGRNYLSFQRSLTAKGGIVFASFQGDVLTHQNDSPTCWDGEHDMHYSLRSSWVLLLALNGCTGGDGGPSPSPTPTATATGSISFQWDPSSGSDLAGYRVYRSRTSGSFGAPIATLPTTTTRYQATGLQKGLEYFFVVSAYDGNGNESQFSNQVSRTVP